MNVALSGRRWHDNGTDLCTFDIISSGTGTLGGGYEILSQDRTNKGRLREGDIKTITLIDEHAKQLSNSIFAYTEMGAAKANATGKTKPLRMASSVKKTITNRTTSITPSMLAAELMNVAKILSITDTTPENQAQPTSTRFVPNLEAIQNALKYDKKLHYPNVLEYEK
ncbi:15478_t:CDS:2, partial [Gigaspora rosea]